MLRCHTPCAPCVLPASLRCSLYGGVHALRLQSALARAVASPSQCVKRRTAALKVSAIASAQPSTVKIITQGRHVEVTDSLKQYVNEKVGKVVVKYEAAIKEVDVKLSVSGGDSGSKGPKKQKTEITIYTIRNGVVRAEDVESSLYASIDLVADKVARKLRKMKEKAIARGKWQGPGGPRGGETIGQSLPSEAEDLVDEFPQEPPAAFPEIVRTKTFNLSPMTLEEALVQVEQVGHDFYLFRDKYTDQVRVLYKRKTSGYGVIVPQLED